MMSRLLPHYLFGMMNASTLDGHPRNDSVTKNSKKTLTCRAFREQIVRSAAFPV